VKVVGVWVESRVGVSVKGRVRVGGKVKIE
jgi:hypothetical protein